MQTFEAPSYRTHLREKNSQGFTLVELSIALVIIGLIVSGILVGTDMIRQAEVRSVIRDIETYKTAISTFRTKYNCIPGDCLIATDVWGVATTNGNNNELLDQPSEFFTFWQHLSLAGLIEGSYTGISGPASTSDAVIGVNVPASKYKNAGYSVFRTYNQDIWAFLNTPGQVIVLGAQFTGSFTQNQAIDVHDTVRIDQKIDDGMPRKGLVRVKDMTVYNNCITGPETVEATYRITNTKKICVLLFPLGF